MASRNTQPPSPPFPGALPDDPAAAYDQLILSDGDKAFFGGLTDERIEAILRDEKEDGNLPFPA